MTVEPSPLRVFLSHTSEMRDYPQDQSFVAAAERAVSRAGESVVDMAYFPLSETRPAAYCREQVRKADVYVGIIGFRYGSPVTDEPGLSYTELEFGTAAEHGLPRLLFLLDEDAVLPLPRGLLSDPEHEDRQRAFRDRAAEAGVMARWVRSPEQVELLLFQSLKELRQQSGLRASVPAAHDIAPRQLPAYTAHFAGRLAEMEALTSLLDRIPVAGESNGGPVIISAVDGMAGIGKTALALHWAHQVAHRFPGGQLYVNLRGFDSDDAPVTPGEAIRGFLDALGVYPARIPADLQAQAGLYRSLLAGREMLIVLDNARDTDQVRPLLPGTSSCLVIVTSRSQLPGLVAAAGARPLPVGLLPVGEARELLARHLGQCRVASEERAVEELVSLCAGLPLALSTVAVRAALRPELPLAALASQLRDACGRLDALDAGDPATSMRAVLSWSCRHLDTAAASMFRLLGTHPGPDISAAAAACLAGLEPRAAGSALATLTRANILAELVPGRFVMHDLVRAYAAEQACAADSEAVRRDALCRVLDHYLGTALAADALLQPARERPPPEHMPDLSVRGESLSGYEDALAWFEAERPVLLAAIAEAASQGLTSRAWLTTRALEGFASFRGHWRDYASAQRTALSAATAAGDVTGQAHALCGLGFALLNFGDGLPVEARANVLRALDLFTQLGDHAGQARAHQELGAIFNWHGRYREALRHCKQALALFRKAGHVAVQGEVLNSIGWCYAQMDDPQRALTYCERAISLLQGPDDRFRQARTWHSLGYANFLLSHHADAITCYQRASDLYRQIGDSECEAYALQSLGDTYEDAGYHDAACLAWQQALAIIDDLPIPDRSRRLRARLLRPFPDGPPIGIPRQRPPSHDDHVTTGPVGTYAVPAP